MCVCLSSLLVFLYSQIFCTTLQNQQRSYLTIYLTICGSRFPVIFYYPSFQVPSCYEQSQLCGRASHIKQIFNSQQLIQFNGFSLDDLSLLKCGFADINWSDIERWVSKLNFLNFTIQYPVLGEVSLRLLRQYICDGKGAAVCLLYEVRYF